MAAKIKLYNPTTDSYTKPMSKEQADRLIEYQERVNSQTKLLREKPGTEEVPDQSTSEE